MTKYFAVAAVLCGVTLARECEDVTGPEVNKECYENMEWAWTTGVKQNISNYPQGVTSKADFQCALFLKKGDAAGPSWNCTLPPCEPLSMDFSQHAMRTGSQSHPAGTTRRCVEETAQDIKERTSSAMEDKRRPSFPWYGWVLAVTGLSMAAVLGVFTWQGSAAKAPTRRKRGVDVPQPLMPKKPVEAVATQLPVYEESRPVYVAHPVASSVADPMVVHQLLPTTTTNGHTYSLVAAQVVTKQPVSYTVQHVVQPPVGQLSVPSAVAAAAR
eukprot:TRINITY_DN122035_c0_g1_i1.p1 TRINITY_DN122035_c0_g1~~TRINITY_DN122035_c0_g1_i1.p1  ORF type:complete len:290 (-),score=36.82 TRINITY_DN122035_c0_g1_i1:380-1192(-)